MPPASSLRYYIFQAAILKLTASVHAHTLRHVPVAVGAENMTCSNIGLDATLVVASTGGCTYVLIILQNASYVAHLSNLLKLRPGD